MIVKYDSITHKVLMLSKFYNKPISYKDCKYIFPSIGKPSDVHRSVLRLSLSGLIQIVDESTPVWIITPAGISLVYEMPSKRPPSFVKDKD